MRRKGTEGVSKQSLVMHHVTHRNHLHSRQSDPGSIEQIYSTLLSDAALTWKMSMPKGDMQVSSVMMSHSMWPRQW